MHYTVNYKVIEKESGVSVLQYWVVSALKGFLVVLVFFLLVNPVNWDQNQQCINSTNNYFVYPKPNTSYLSVPQSSTIAQHLLKTSLSLPENDYIGKSSLSEPVSMFIVGVSLLWL